MRTQELLASGQGREEGLEPSGEGGDGRWSVGQASGDGGGPTWRSRCGDKRPLLWGEIQGPVGPWGPGGPLCKVRYGAQEEPGLQATWGSARTQSYR